jgi:hypothetical protein
MDKGISFRKIWFDKDCIELEIKTSDGASSFSNKVYVGYGTLDNLISDLDRFKDQVYGGIYDIQLGEFGPEYAGGAFHARLHFHKPGRLYITVKVQTDFEEFTKTSVASEATLYLTSEPGLLDNFIIELKRLKSGVSDEAYLQST